MSELKTLFDEWKKAHKTDSNWKSNFPMDPRTKEYPDEDFKESFTIDGKLDEKTDEIKILFICRESNVGGKADKSDAFWMREVFKVKQENEKNGTCNYYGSNLSASDKRAQTTYYNYLKEIATLKKVELQSCAYMNLNKRGGYGGCTFSRLEKYVENYEGFIKDEVKLLNPEMVVFLGYCEGYGKKVLEMIEKVKPGIKCCKVYHPSARGSLKTKLHSLGTHSLGTGQFLFK